MMDNNKSDSLEDELCALPGVLYFCDTIVYNKGIFY